MVALLGCDRTPSIDNVAAGARAQLQNQVQRDFSAYRLTVQKIDVVALGTPKYSGIATIALRSATFTVPLEITSDGKTTIVSADDRTIAMSMASAIQAQLSVLNGKYSDYVVAPAVFGFFPDSLKSQKAEFVERLSVVTPVVSDRDFYFGSGCMAHECGSNEAAWVIEKDTGAAAAIVMKELPNGPGETSFHLTFHIYGTTAATLPEALAEWAADHGMTTTNVVEDVPAYQAPPR